MQNNELTTLTIDTLPVYAFCCQVSKIDSCIIIKNCTRKLCEVLGCKGCQLKKKCYIILSKIKRDDQKKFDEFIEYANIGDSFTGSSVINDSIYGRLFMQEESTVVNVNEKYVECAVFLTDVTSLKVANNALEITEEKLDLVLDALQLGIWDAYTCLDCIHVSNLAFTLIGYCPEGIEPTFKNLIKIIHVDDRKMFISMIKASSNNISDQAFMCNVRIKHPDDTYVLYIIRGKVVARDKNGKPTRLFGLIGDVSDNVMNLIREDKIENIIYALVKKRTHELESELEIAKKAKKQVLENLHKERELSNMKSVFVNMVSHEFRTPLAVIQMAADLFQQYSDQLSIDEKNSHLDTIKLSVKRMTNTMEDILMLGKCQNAQLKFNPQDICIVAFCQNILEEVEMFKESKRIIFATDKNVSDIVCIDKSLMYHVIVNLLNNSLKYSDADKVVLFKLEYLDDKLKILIKDQGIGIPKKDIHNMFNIFYRGSNIGNRNGLGIGMYIVKHCVKLHNGEIDVSSEENIGTTFCIAIPA